MKQNKASTPYLPVFKYNGELYDVEELKIMCINGGITHDEYIELIFNTEPYRGEENEECVKEDS